MPPVTATVTACDIVTAYGPGMDACWNGLVSGRTAIGELHRFNTTSFSSRRAAIVPGLDAGSDSSLVMQMLAPLLTKAAGSVPADTAVILATTTGEIDLLERSILTGVGNARDSLPTGLLERACSILGITGPAMLVSSACASSTAAIAMAAAMVRAGETDSVLVVACDSVTEFVFSGFSTLMALDPDGARPFDSGRKGLTPGDAAGYMLIMSDARARAENRSCLGEIAGWGMTNDANHMTGPSRDGRGLASAVNRALASAGCGPDAIAAICAHGTGTSFNDAMEMKALRLVFGDTPVPTCSIKGGLGHTMGAAGLVEAAIALESLRRNVLPPTVNTVTVDSDAEGWISPVTVPIGGADTALSTNSGFGGVNAALVLRRANGQRPTANIKRSTAVAGVVGIGWIDGNGYGRVRTATRGTYTDEPGLSGLWRETDIFRTPVKNYGRFDTASKLTCCACALAMSDAGLAEREIGILGTNRDGCLESNIEYFRDYVDCGRTLSRGNLFIYTLPSSPIAEAAIHLGLTGPTLYIAGPASDPATLFRTAARMLAGDETDAMLAVHSDGTQAICFALAQQRADNKMLCGLDAALIIVENADCTRIDTLVARFAK